MKKYLNWIKIIAVIICVLVADLVTKHFLFDVEYVIPRYSGVLSFENADLYLPDTEYSILAFGGANVQGNVLHGYATTPLFRYDYRTLEAVPANNRITNIEIFGPYDYYEIRDKYPDFEFAQSVANLSTSIL